MEVRQKRKSKLTINGIIVRWRRRHRFRSRSCRRRQRRRCCSSRHHRQGRRRCRWEQLSYSSWFIFIESSTFSIKFEASKGNGLIPKRCESLRNEFFVPIFSTHLVLEASTKWFIVARVEKELGPIKLNRQACKLDVGTQIYLSSRIKS